MMVMTMSIFSTRLSWLFLLITALSQIHVTLGEMLCEELPNEYCAYAVATSGKRCVLEHYTSKEGVKEYQCKTSEVVVERLSEYIETEECVRACGVDRKVVGISSDALLETPFIVKLCSPQCYRNCPNIIDLYFNLAAGEGAYLPSVCQNPRRFMGGLMSSGYAAGPSPLMSAGYAPVPSPAGPPFN